TRVWWGALINEQNALSLARLQTTLWTILIGSAYITAATTNALVGEDSAGPSREQLANADREVEVARGNVARAESQLKAEAGTPKEAELAKHLEELQADLAKKERAAKDLQASRHPGSSVIAIPTAVWLLLGVSLASLAGSPLILSYKKQQAPNPQEVDETLKALQQQRVDPSTIKPKGQVIAKTDLKEATISDLFRGEETGNAARLDLGRLQLFF